jgi:sulfite exporter TauE/SafE
MGLVGSAFVFSPSALGILTILAGIFMLFLGLQITGIFPRLTSFSFSPKLAEKLGIDNHRRKTYNHFSTMTLGLLTFFLPCGFTQAMQLFAVSTGSWQTGALVMGLFAIGTTPGLLLVGGLVSLVHGKKTKNILKVVGVIVIGFAFFSISSGGTMAGIDFNFAKNTEKNISDSQTNCASGQNSSDNCLLGEDKNNSDDAANLTKIFSNSEIGNLNSPILKNDNSGIVVPKEYSNIPQENILPLTFVSASAGFDKKELRVKVGQKYLLAITPQANGLGCMSAVMLPRLSNQSPQLLQKGKKIFIAFEAKTVGEFQLVCAMGVSFKTKIIVEK